MVRAARPPATDTPDPCNSGRKLGAAVAGVNVAGQRVQAAGARVRAESATGSVTLPLRLIETHVETADVVPVDGPIRDVVGIIEACLPLHENRQRCAADVDTVCPVSNSDRAGICAAGVKDVQIGPQFGLVGRRHHEAVRRPGRGS